MATKPTGVKRKRQDDERIRSDWTKLGEQVWCLAVRGLPTAGPNGPKGLFRMHWARRKAYQAAIYIAALQPGRPCIKGKAMITYLRFYRALPMDADNLAASAKPVLDGLVRAGVIENDDPQHVALHVMQEKRRKNMNDWAVIVTPAS